MSQQYPGLKLLKSEAEKCLEDEDVVIFFNLYVLLYADDTIVMAENESDLQLALNAMQQYCNDWKLVVNVKKTKVVIFSKGKVKKHINFMYNGESVEVVDNYTYLGITLNVNSVAVACGARLSCSVFMVYSVLLFVSLVASAPI